MATSVLNFFPIKIIKPYNSIEPKLLREYIKSDDQNPSIYYVIVLLSSGSKLIFLAQNFAMMCL